MVQRYEWEDALINAQTSGHLSNGGLLAALKLARAINWAPRQGRDEPGLYWKNDTAFAAVGLGRSTYYSHRTELFELGFFDLVRGNLMPCIPASLPETTPSRLKTKGSESQTGESRGQQSFSEDSFSEDIFPEDVSSDNGADANASAVQLGKRDEDPSLTLDTTTLSTSSPIDRSEHLEETQESLVETSDEVGYATLMSDWYAQHPQAEVAVEQAPAPHARGKHSPPTVALRTIPQPSSRPSVPSQSPSSTYWEEVL